MNQPLRCKECGASFQSADSALTEQLLAAHTLSQHGTIEQRHTKTLTKALALFTAAAMGQRIAKQDAVTVGQEISSLLGLPFIALQVNNPVTPAPAPAPAAQKEVPKDVAPSIHSRVAHARQAVPDVKSAVPAEHGGAPAVQPINPVGPTPGGDKS